MTKWLLQIILAVSIPVTTFASLPFAPVLATGQTQCYDTAGVGIDCAATGQDGEMQNGLQWPQWTNMRFTDKADGTVKDNITGLIWLKKPNCLGRSIWADALVKTNNLASGSCGLTDGSNVGDWRLPNINELKSLIDLSMVQPSLPGDHTTVFDWTNPYIYWSSNTYAGYPGHAWFAHMGSGGLDYNDKQNPFFVWPVRDDVTTNNILVKTGQHVSYAEGDDGALQKGVQWPTTRFTDNNDGSITDNITGLIWLRNANCFGNKNWAEALISASSLVSGDCGLSDGSREGEWVLPNVNELESLIDITQSSPALTSGHPFYSVQPNLYWSSTTYAYPGTNFTAWRVDMSHGIRMTGENKGSAFYVWPVKSKRYWEFNSLFISAPSKFGTLYSVAPASPYQITIANRSTSFNNITAIRISGTNTSEFGIETGGSSPCSSLSPTLIAGESCTLMASFSPSSSGTKSASLDITANGITKNIPLSGKTITTVYGTVTDQATGLPVSGATVTLNTSATATTDVAGNYNFGNLPAATYSISVANSGYQTTSRNNFVVTTAASAKADVLLPTIATLNITTSSFPWASPNVYYSSRVMVAGGAAPYIFSKSYGTLPTGLLLDTTTGTISGTPTGSGSYTFAIGVIDKASGYSEKEFTLELLPALQITTSVLPSGQQGFPYNSSVTATGGKPAYSFAAVGMSLPNGLTLGSNGTITGIPREFGTFNVSVKLTDSTGRALIKSCSLTVAAATALALNATTLSSGYVGANYSAALSASGGVPPPVLQHLRNSPCWNPL